MAFKMTNAPFQKETKAERKAANKAYRQGLRQDRKNDRDAKPYVKGTKNTGELLDKLANPKKTEEKHGVKKGLKAMAALGTAGALIPKIYKKLVGPMINGIRYPAGYEG